MRKYILFAIFVTLAIPFYVFSQPSGSPFGPVPPSNLAYNAATWNGSYLAPTQNAVRDWIEGAGGGGIGGADTQVQYNDGGNFGGDAGFTYNDVTKAVTITKDAIGATPVDTNGIRISNTTAAAAGAQQYSPPLVMQGQGWKTDATAASQKVEFMQDVRPVEGAAAPTGYWGIYPSIADAAYSATPAMTVNSAGNVGIGTTSPGGKLEITADGGATALKISRTGSASTGIFDLSSARLNLTATNGLLTLSDVTTDATNKVSRIGVTHYTNAEEPFLFYLASTTAVTNGLAIGGGSTLGNVATQISFYTATDNTTITGTERVRIDSSGKVGIGTTEPDTQLELSKDSADTEATISTYHDTEATSPVVTLRKADNTEAAPAAVDDNAVLGTMKFKGYDGDSWANGAYIQARVDGSPGNGDLPTEIVFATSADGTEAPANSMIISPAGIVTKPRNPAFGALIGAEQVNVTGNDVTYDITGAIWTERYDLGTNFVNGTFTAPVNGIYAFTAVIYLYPIAARQCQYSLITSNESFVLLAYSGGNYEKFNPTWQCYMDAADTAYLTTKVIGGAQDVEVGAGTWFTGFLIN